MSNWTFRWCFQATLSNFLSHCATFYVGWGACAYWFWSGVDSRGLYRYGGRSGRCLSSEDSRVGARHGRNFISTWSKELHSYWSPPYSTDTPGLNVSLQWPEVWSTWVVDRWWVGGGTSRRGGQGAGCDGWHLGSPHLEIATWGMMRPPLFTTQTPHVSAPLNQVRVWIYIAMNK